MEINYQLIFTLLKMGAHEKHINASTSDLAKTMGVSQQTASRWLINFEKDGFIERDRSGIKLTHKSMDELKSLSEMLLGSLDAKRKLRLKGEVISGMRDGKYYMGISRYKKQFNEKLGVVPYPGTLNVKINDLEAKLILSDRRGLVIEGFSHNGRILGELKCFPCIIDKKVKGYVVLPSRSHYGLDILEIISKDNLRKKLRLKDGDKVDFQIWLG